MAETDGLPDIRAFLPQFIRGVVLLVSVAILIFLSLGWSEWALGVAFGALIFGGNLIVFARDLVRSQAIVEDKLLNGEPQSATMFRGARMGLRLVLVALALAIILWYMPARPEGLVIGVCLVLVAAAFAARSSSS